MIRAATILYALFITGIVICASNGWFSATFAWVKSYASDKALHFTLVGTMALLLNLSFNCAAIRPDKRWLMWGTTIMLVVATVEEFSQIFVPKRTFDLLDLSCNYLGIMVLGRLALLFRNRNLE